jgi:translocation and assembly module TamB
MNATIRGSLAKPQLSGRMKFADASFYMTDFPNGLDQVNGEVMFDQNRATIVDRLSAQTGGGQVDISGFVGLGAGELTYRLQTRAEDVRVRYPEGVSTTASAQLSLTGTTTHSMLTGIITVKRVGFNPHTDIGGLLASSATPVATPTTPNEFLRNLHLDVRVESVPNLQFQASMTNNLQAEVNLRVRGTAAKPALSGRISVNQGDITFFGNKYTITRGEIAFYNQTKIEPVVDLELESRVRGILVDISLAGTFSKLNVSYRSDPPLQSNEIIALLAVGRTPGTYSALAASQTVTQGSLLDTGGNALLGQAVTAPLSSRLQRFFGVSKLKIDPLLTGVNSVPQARLTLEQQISKNITLTYVQNISQANQQIVRLEIDLNRNWSVVAVREENGVFGVDFFYKKAFR